MKTSRLWRGVKLILGMILIPLGIVGLFLPVLQEVLFLVVGLLLLSSEIPFLARLRDKLRARHPAPFQHAETWGERAADWFRAHFGRKDGPAEHP